MKILHGMASLKGIPPLLYIVVNLCFWLVFLLPLALLKMLLPFNRFRDVITKAMAWIYTLAVWCDDLLFLRIMGIRLDIAGLRQEYPEKFYIVVANHQTWNDIFILQHIFNGRAPVIKFLVKRELIFLPIVGLICLAYGYPFLSRRSVKGRLRKEGQPPRDFAVLEKALRSFSRYPATMINLAEGTRFSPAKASHQQSPYRYLLRPRAGGLTTMLGLLRDQVGALLDVTIVYDSGLPTFWDFLCGKCRRVAVRVKEYSRDEILPLHDFETVAAWMNRVWEAKDREIGVLRQGLPSSVKGP